MREFTNETVTRVVVKIDSGPPMPPIGDSGSQSWVSRSREFASSMAHDSPSRPGTLHYVQRMRPIVQNSHQVFAV
jgi:hypothetical protein